MKHPATKPLDLVAGSSSFSTLDLPSGYWQVQLSPEYRPKTGGLWQFRVLSNSSTTFESLMDSVLAGVLWQRFLVYLDERLVHGSIFAAALDAPRQLMERVTAAGLKSEWEGRWRLWATSCIIKASALWRKSPHHWGLAHPHRPGPT